MPSPDMSKESFKIISYDFRETFAIFNRYLRDCCSWALFEFEKKRTILYKFRNRWIRMAFTDYSWSDKNQFRKRYHVDQISSVEYIPNIGYVLIATVNHGGAIETSITPALIGHSVLPVSCWNFQHVALRGSTQSSKFIQKYYRPTGKL